MLRTNAYVVCSLNIVLTFVTQNIEYAILLIAKLGILVSLHFFFLVFYLFLCYRLFKKTCFPCFRYLKEFRTEQCPLFLQHKCTQHRPFTCFNWHFLNQRRRRPIRRRDGTFNYSPDVYCTKYDETTGICPDGDE